MTTSPIHPLADMQAAFEESMQDATGQTGFVPLAVPNKSIKARQQLLCRDDDAKELAWNPTYACHWRHHPRGRFHPLLKTTAQIVFGVHLLHQHLEKSIADVADILLKHVNELDCFLQRANDDMDASLKDMLFRRKCLQVPMEHVNEFDRLLEDPNYRAQLLDGNVTIERTMTRMSTLIDDYLVDMSTFRDAVQTLDAYLLDIGQEWTHVNDDVARIYSAMRGNTRGWSQFLQSLAAKIEKLGVVLVQVSSYCNEIEKRCGAASRRDLMATRTSSRNSSNSRDNGRSMRNFANNKPLPTVPSERPPFMTPSANSSAILSDAPSGLRHSTIRAIPQTQAEYARRCDVAGTPKRSQDSASSSAACSIVNIGVQRRNDAAKPEHIVQERGRAAPQTARRTSQLSGHQRVIVTQESTPAQTHPSGAQQQRDRSPVMACKDSAYSSVSGVSVASPLQHPAFSPPSQTQPQFGLFPSSSISSNHRPNSSLSVRPGSNSSTTALPTYTPERSTTSLSSPETGGKRLSRRSSLTSLKQLFSKKKRGKTMGAILE
ncbi:hypothetical protein P153DRAFT_396086 [Dothidotthia symphoricarpi CBS 119687]|uniref:Karyogamy protein n=1 Tax=Dothidotthia symphoricarpi CBS 119687 TaxID=1392245 RepID=A0A6A6AFC9_9PLEO|nr:uncharacterized protein P153DRAFT_396086 [Dothidotthia symphoricarpi CBS 119687]KAF2129738.1 hypothetical protein P153DRAFT_396086 [Dothidotthia symphoricarpi CBS 119687]